MEKLLNRTGIATSPQNSHKMILEAGRRNPSSLGNETEIRKIRMTYIQESESIGSVPSISLKQEPKKGAGKRALGRPTVLLDKLSERLAFERTGTRLYDALIAKCESSKSKTPAFFLKLIKRFRLEELQHFGMVFQSIQTLGGDPSAVSPSADVNGVLASGIIQVLSDPRTTAEQNLEALLVAEMADRSGWELLIQLTDVLGLADMSNSFRKALAEEQIHIETISKYYEQLVMQEARLAA